MKIGLCFGRYAPFCKGHLDLIMQAKKECDMCFVIVMGSIHDTDVMPSAEQGELAYTMSFPERVAYVENYFEDSQEVRVLALDDDDLYPEIPLTEKGWQLWTAAAEHLIFADPAVQPGSLFRWYVRDPEWRDALMHVSTTADPVKALLEEGRFEIFISPTKGSPEPVIDWHSEISLEKESSVTFAPPLAFSAHGCPTAEAPCRILITGTASEGKSTLARDVARYFGIPYVPEAARDYMLRHHLADEALTADDFLAFVREQNALIEAAAASHAPAILVDTDNITTLAYAISYAEDAHVAAVDVRCVNAVREELKVYPWDKIYVLAPRNTYVDDGLRYMNQADMAVREEGFRLLLRLFEEYGLTSKVEVLCGDFYANYLHVRDYIAGQLPR